MKKTFGIIIGALLIAAGVLFALNNLGIMQFDVSLEGWWTVFIIAPSLYGLVMHRDKIGNLIVLLIGVYLLLAARGIIEYGAIWELIVPTIIVLIGIKLIIKAVNSDGNGRDNITEGTTECAAVFASKTKNYSGNDVKQANVCAVFGGMKCNFADVTFAPNSKIDLFCMFGGADIIIPENVEIKVNAVCLFGGIADKRVINSSAKKTATLTIDGFCLFGGADII